MQENLYWLVTSDLVNLLNHNRISCELIAKNEHIDIWFEMVSYFQTMNLNVRKFGEHVLQEQPTYFSAFSAELECCSSIMWSLVQYLTINRNISSEDVSHITSTCVSLTSAQLTKKLVKTSLESLRKWLNNIGFMTAFVVKRPNYKHISFHLPLHR